MSTPYLSRTLSLPPLPENDTPSTFSAPPANRETVATLVVVPAVILHSMESFVGWLSFLLMRLICTVSLPAVPTTSKAWDEGRNVTLGPAVSRRRLSRERTSGAAERRALRVAFDGL